MADIAAEIAWMRGHAVKQAVENEATQRKRDAEHRAQVARTCPYCFHDRHEIDWGGATEASVLWCRTDDCLCGVYPCMQCGDRSRNRGTETHLSRCPACGHEWTEGAFA